jgi:hypothetical protein
MSATTARRTATYTVTPIHPTVCEELRSEDDSGHRPEVLTDPHGGSPLRCCLTMSRPGEEIMLAAYAPLRRWAEATGANPGPYLEVGPVFLHPMPCGGATSSRYPEAYRGSSRVLRAYDHGGRILGGVVLATGAEPDPLIDSVFADPQVAFIHARALIAGCFTFWIDRR